MNCTTDTHPLIWYFTENPMLSKRVLRIFEETVKSGSIVIPSIVLAEVMFIAHRSMKNLRYYHWILIFLKLLMTLK
jgi:predicted nucleic-acid-binding protein